MPRDIPVSNGQLLICFDKDYQIRDLYFPHVGQENHVVGYPCRFGAWVDGRLAWSTDPGWTKKLRYLPDTLVTDVEMHHAEMELSIHCHDFVDYSQNYYARRISVTNHSHRQREVKVFFHQDLRIYGSEVGDTGFYDPDGEAVVHYKGKRFFLFGLSGGIRSYSIGAKALRHAEGTWRDAEDGELANTIITHGSVDSTICKRLCLFAHSSVEFDYWACVGFDLQEVQHLHAQICNPGYLDSRLRGTSAYWRLWVNKEDLDLSPLPENIQELFKRSLLVLRTQIDNGGAITAANDSDVQPIVKDHYSYLWPRDGAFVAQALDLAGYQGITKRFYRFLSGLLSEEGYLYHKYTPTGTLASSWHPWVRAGKRQLPIQEDETALVLWGLWEHFQHHRDVEFAREMYESFILKAADFLVAYRDAETGLPLPSFDLWEERRGVMTFTCCAVEAGLRAAANFAKAFGDGMHLIYMQAAQEVKAAIYTHLYDPERGHYLRGLVNPHDHSEELLPDATVDMSCFGLFRFGTFPVTDERVQATMKACRRSLSIKTEVGGFARYQGDWYQIRNRPSEEVPGNPWHICTLWAMLEEILAARQVDELTSTMWNLEWVARHAAPSGILSEQVDPHDGQMLSVSPLTWSHSTVVEVVMLYLLKLRELEVNRNVLHPLRCANLLRDSL